MRLSSDAFAAVVQSALTDIPTAIVAYMHEVTVDVEPMPDAATCAAADVDDPRGLMGLYHGTPLTDRSVQDTHHLPDRITLYQRNIERACRTRAELIRQIRTTVLHEVGHHFGMDEDDLAELGYG